MLFVRRVTRGCEVVHARQGQPRSKARRTRTGAPRRLPHGHPAHGEGVFRRHHNLHFFLHHRAERAPAQRPVGDVVGSQLQRLGDHRAASAGIQLRAPGVDRRIGVIIGKNRVPGGACGSVRTRRAYLRIRVLLPNRLSIRSTASVAVWLRTSSAGFSSMTSSEARRPVSAIISMHSCASR